MDFTPRLVKSISLMPAMLAQDSIAPRSRAAGPVSNIYEVAKRAGVSPSTVSRVLSQPNVVSIKTRLKVLQGGRRPRLHSQLDRQEPAHVPHRQAARHRPRHLEPVLLAHPAGHRGRRAARGLRGARRRHAARRTPGAALRPDAEQQGGGRPDLPRPSPARSGGGAGARRGAALRADRERLRVQSAPRHPERAHRQRARGLRRDAPALRSRATSASAIITGPLVSPLSRDRLRGASTTAKKRGAEELAVIDGDFSVESGSGGGAAAASPRRARRPRSSASTTRWRWACSTSRGTSGSACRAICRSSASTTSASPATPIRP